MWCYLYRLLESLFKTLGTFSCNCAKIFIKCNHILPSYTLFEYSNCNDLKLKGQTLFYWSFTCNPWQRIRHNYRLINSVTVSIGAFALCIIWCRYCISCTTQDCYKLMNLLCLCHTQLVLFHGSGFHVWYVFCLLKSDVFEHSIGCWCLLFPVEKSPQQDTIIQ